MTGPVPSPIRGRDQFLVAHRGFSARCPENTMAAFRAAAPLSDYLELDLHPTADGAAVVVHDAILQRTTDVADVFPERRNDPVSSFTAAELSRLDAGSWFSEDHAGARLPSLPEVAEVASAAGAGLFIEVKEREQLDVIIDAVSDVAAAWPDLPLVVGSIDLVLVAELRRILRDVPTAALFLDGALGGSALAAVSEIAGLLAFRHDLLPSGLVDAVHARGCAIMHNTNTRTSMDWGMRSGIDGGATDWPSRKAAGLAGRQVTTIEGESLWGTAQADGPITIRLGKEAGFKPSGGADLSAALQPAGRLLLPFDVTEPCRLATLTLDCPPPGCRLALAIDGVEGPTVDTRARSNRRAAVDPEIPLSAGHHVLTLRVMDTSADIVRVAVDTLELDLPERSDHAAGRDLRPAWSAERPALQADVVGEAEPGEHPLRLPR